MSSILRKTISSTPIIPRQTFVRHIFGAEQNLKKRAGSKIGPAKEEFVKPIPKTSTLAKDVVNDVKATAQIASDVVRQAYETVTGSTSDHSGTTSIHKQDNNNNNNMTSSDEKPNSSGLTPSESRKLAVRQPSAEDKPIMDAVKSFYECKPKNQDYDIFSDTAVFVDPLSLAEGIERIKVQYNGLVALFPKAEVKKFNLLENPKTLSSNILLIDQVVDYYRSKEADAQVTKQLNSLLTITKGNDGKVIKLVEEWEHSQLKNQENSGFLGMLNEGRKKAFAAACMPFIDQEAPESKKQ